MRIDKRTRIAVDVGTRDLFMRAKPRNMTSALFIRALLLDFKIKTEKAVANAYQETDGVIRIIGEPGLASYGGGWAGPDEDGSRLALAMVTGGSCIGRPKGAKDLKPRKRRQKKMKLEVGVS